MEQPRKFPKGRRPSDAALGEVEAVLGDMPRERSLLVEYLHGIQDGWGRVSRDHMAALAQIMGMSMAEVHGVASFYHHFIIEAPRGTGTDHMPDQIRGQDTGQGGQPHPPRIPL
ncbi:MAG: NAD(P)H-dependent oxidoreductase subunit E, partial [Desulfobacterales bacterium]|nr:NAD(P)H-dependent oxidoreductase subunit E [Desulfobacterales bacterium]